MSAELLTPENVAKASKLGEENPYFSHPMLRFLRDNGYSMQHAAHIQTITKNPNRKARYLIRDSAQIALDMNGVEDFSLKPLELIAVWAHTETYQAIQPIFASILVLSYVGRGFSSKDDIADLTWGRALPVRYIEDGKLPPFVTRKQAGLLEINNQLEDIKGSLTEISTYIEGHGSTPLLNSLMENLNPAVLIMDNRLKEFYWINTAATQLTHQSTKDQQSSPS